MYRIARTGMYPAFDGLMESSEDMTFAGEAGGAEYLPQEAGRDSAAPGSAAVYLDGEKVGRIVSRLQAEEMRLLSRSGWQA